MPDTEEKTVDIDTTGPGAVVDISEDKKPEDIVETVEPVVEEEKVEEKKEEVKEEIKEEVKEEPRTADQETPAEEKPKEELEQYSEGVQKRISKLTKKWREAERQKEAALDYAKGVQVESSKIQTRLSKLEPSYVTAIENRVISGLQAAKAKLQKAREAGDIDAEVDASKDIARLGVEESRVASLKARQAETKPQEVRTPTLEEAIAPTGPTDPKARAWADRNDWFGQDNAMTYTAMDLHEKLTKEEGFDPKSDEYYVEVDKRMRLDFPHKFVNTTSQESTKLTQTVASAKRSVQPGRKTVRLTSSQVTIAKKLGVPLEEYAKQLKLTKEA
jgi:hypothetical protein